MMHIALRFIIAFLFQTTLLVAAIFKPETFTLKNGLTVVVVNNPIAATVGIAVIYKIGTADDPADQIGLSHFLEHMMFKGTKTIPAGECARLILSHGGHFNAHTTTDLTSYTTAIPKAHFKTVLKIEGDRMQNLLLDKDILEKERQVVMEERLMRLDNDPFGPTSEGMLRSLYWYHPYGIPPIGYPHHIKAYTRESLEKHYTTYYVPNNAILVLAGDVTAEEARPLVEDYFGAIPSQPVPERARPKEPDHKGATQTLVFQSPRISMVNYSTYYPAPNFRGEKKDLFYSLIVLSQILGGNETSRLYHHLVDEKHLAVEVSASYSGASYDPRYFSISFTLAPQVKIGDLQEVFESDLHKLVDQGVTDKELAAAKRDIIAGLAFAKDGIHDVSSFFEPLAIGMTIEEIEGYPDAIQAVTREQVNAAAREILSHPATFEVTTYPGEEKTSSLAPKGTS